MLCEIAAIVLVTRRWSRSTSTAPGGRPCIATGADARRLVRGHRRRARARSGASTPSAVALRSRPAPLSALTRILGPLPKLLILIGNAITPGKGFREGPFSTETELRELVDLAEASAVIESGERKMIHSVFELGDTTVREVMVPRNDVVYIERHKNLRQTMSLFLRSGFSRVPGDRREPRRRRRLRLPQGRRPPRLRGARRRVHPAGRGDHAAGPTGCRTPSRSTTLLARDAGAAPAHRRRRRRVRRHRRPGHHRGRARGDRRRDHRRVRRRGGRGRDSSTTARSGSPRATRSTTSTSSSASTSRRRTSTASAA